MPNLHPTPAAEPLMRGYEWLASESLIGFNILQFGLTRGLVPRADVPKLGDDSREAAVIIETWLVERGVTRAWQQRQAAQAVPVACPPWCTARHEQSVIEPGESIVENPAVLHTKVISEQDGCKLVLEFLQAHPDDSPDAYRPELVFDHNTKDGRETVIFSDAAAVSVLAGHLFEAAEVFAQATG